MFATDRDLLVLEPNLFRDVAWAGQRLVSATGSISGATLTLSQFDVDLASAGVTAGHVATVDGVSYEVLTRLSPASATVSRLRAGTTDPALPPSPASGRPVTIASFRPQIALIHHQVLRMLGIEPMDPPALGRPTETSITNPDALARLEALGALHLILAAAAALEPPGGPLGARADLYRARFGDERQRAAARIDLDGDGLPDATRRLNVIQLMRA